VSGDLAAVLGLVQGAFATGFVVFLRVGAAMALLPAFGEQTVPERVRLVLALAFTVIVAPSVAPEVAVALARPEAWALYATEPLIGLIYGLSLRLMVMALQIAGTMAAQATSLAQMFAGIAAEPLPVIGQILMLAGLAAAVTLGLHLAVAEALIGTYALFPPGTAPPAGDMLAWGTERIAASFSLAFGLAMPFAIAALIYNVALGVINRAMPQLMVAFVGAPALTAGGLLLLYAAAPVMLSVWITALGRVLEQPF
jgi:flagellar biosynthetic protein FliR